MIPAFIFYILSRLALNAQPKSEDSEHFAPGLFLIEKLRMNKNLSTIQNEINAAKQQYDFDKTIYYLSRKYEHPERLAKKLLKFQESEKILSTKYREGMLIQQDVNDLAYIGKTRHDIVTMENAVDFAYEMAYKNKMSRIPASVLYALKKLVNAR